MLFNRREKYSAVTLNYLTLQIICNIYAYETGNQRHGEGHN